MRSSKIILGGFFIGAVLLSLGAAFQEWTQSPSTASLSSLLLDPQENGKILVASSNQLFEIPEGLPDSRKSWKKASSLPSSASSVLRLYRDPENSGNVLVLTGKFLFRVNLSKKRPELLYRETSSSEKLLSFAASKKHWFLGTSSGIQESTDGGRSWRPLSGFSNQPACALSIGSGQILAASSHALFLSKDSYYFRKVLEIPKSPVGEFSDETEEEPLETEPEEPVSTGCSIHEIVTSGAWRWAATDHGLFQSFDKGLHWKKLSQSGLESPPARFAAYERKTRSLFTASGNKVYLYDYSSKRWREIFSDPRGSEIRALALDSARRTISVLSETGLFSYPLPDGVKLPQPDPVGLGQRLLFQQLVRLEPTVRQVQKAVVRDANLSNWKTRRWHAESRLRALLPNLSFGKDFSSGNNIDLDRGGTSDKDIFIQGPEDTSRGWDFDVSWDLGDFIFSTSQTSIDSREKMMVELRHDFTAEATRFYYERRRLQTEVLLLPAADEMEHAQRLIQIEELTALLDSMTNGFMTGWLEQLYRERPELRELWKYNPGAPEHQSPGSPEKPKSKRDSNGRGLQKTNRLAKSK